VNFSFTPEQEALRAEARRFLSERVDVRAQINQPGAHDAALWKQMAELGWQGALVREEHGGTGMSLVNACVLFEEAGRALLPGPFLLHVIATQAIARGGGDALLPDLVSGSKIAGFWLCYATQLDEGMVTGDAELVPGASTADVLVIGLKDRSMAVAPSGSFAATEVDSADLTRPRATVAFDGPAGRLPSPDVSGSSVRASVAIAAESVGAARAALDMAVAYARERTQFGKPIGSFQAIKHKAADMLRAVEAARLAVYYAAWAIDAVEPGHAVATAHAKVAANEAFLLCAKENIQIHGGIGVTWEHDAHLYYRRALANATMFGESAVNRDRIALAAIGEVT
jgi:alkylation response protein AidB-like acyl-CoA dehydrogenase